MVRGASQILKHNAMMAVAHLIMFWRWYTVNVVELVTAFRQELQEEETLSRNIHTNTRLPNK